VAWRSTLPTRSTYFTHELHVPPGKPPPAKEDEGGHVIITKGDSYIGGAWVPSAALAPFTRFLLIQNEW
jgi:hypothetical protein